MPCEGLIFDIIAFIFPLMKRCFEYILLLGKEIMTILLMDPKLNFSFVPCEGLAYSIHF